MPIFSPSSYDRAAARHAARNARFARGLGIILALAFLIALTLSATALFTHAIGV